MSKEMLITPEDVVVTLSHGGYVKRLPLDTYRSQGRGGRGIKGGQTRDDDFIEHLFVGNTHDYLLFFTNKGRVYQIRVFDVPEGSRTSGGRSVAQLLDFQPGEKVARALSIPDMERSSSFLMFATRGGTVKKTALKAFANIRTNGIIAIGLDDGDELIGVEVTGGEDDVMLATKKGQAIRFPEGKVRAMGRPAGGVVGVKFKRKGDEVVSMVVVPRNGRESCQILTACVNGYGKRTVESEYPVKNRGGMGVINIEASKRNGDVVGMTVVCDENELMMITEKGIMIRTKVGDIRETGRNAQGVRLMRLDEGDRLVAMAKIDAEPNGEPDAGGTLGTDGDAAAPSDDDGEAPAEPAE
jgi:DNA gyrase subunit A